MWAGTSVSSKDFNTLNRFMCLTWLYKVTSSLNSFLNTGLQWYLLLKERCCNSCTCSDSLAEVRQLCWSIRPHNSSFPLGKRTQLYQGKFRQGTRSDVAFSTRDKGKISQDLLCLFSVPLLFLQATGQRAGFEPSSIWGNSLGLGTSPPLLLSISGTSPCLSQHWAREGNLGMSRALPGNSLVPPHSEQGLCFVTTWGGASFPKENFPLWGSSQNRNPLCWVWDLGVWRAEVLKSYFCMAFHLLLSGTKWHQQGGKLQLLVFLGVSSFVCSLGIAPRM